VPESRATAFLFPCGPVARNPPQWQRRIQRKARLSGSAVRQRRLALPLADDERMNETSLKKESNNRIEAEASRCATLRINGTGSRAVPWFEGAHLLRRCAPDSKSAHLGKSRCFLRRCAPFSKVRTKNCAPSRTERGKGVEAEAVVARLYASTAPGPGRRPGGVDRDTT
jgi:hypothetical protein